MRLSYAARAVDEERVVARGRVGRDGVGGAHGELVAGADLEPGPRERSRWTWRWRGGSRRALEQLFGVGDPVRVVEGVVRRQRRVQPNDLSLEVA